MSDAPPEGRDEKLARYLVSLPYETLTEPFVKDDVKWFVWLLDVPEGQLCKAEDEALSRAFELWGDEPLPFLLSSASVEKSNRLRARAP
jgi:hypothetical protein